MGKLLTILALTLLAGSARADAVIVTRAMRATTIAEVFVEPGAIRVELEIGIPDLPAFADLLPEELRERLGLEPEPLEERVPRFFREGLVLRPENGEPLAGAIVGARGGTRVVRDEITGAPLPNQPEDAEGVVFMELAYSLAERPAALGVRPPTNADGRTVADLGFQLYHEGVAVNDYRYLAQEEVIDLDWSDPWYSRFQNRNLQRRFSEPIAAFLYVEPTEVRKEIVLRPRDLQRWVDLGLEGQDLLPADAWGTVMERTALFLAPRAPVLIDGRAVEPILDRIHFIERTLRMTAVVDPPRDLPLASATLGVIFRYPIAELPQEVTMEWDLFPEQLPRVPSSATDEAGGLPSFLTPDDPELVWTNFLLNPTVPGLLDAPRPEPRRPILPVLSLAALAAAGVLLLRRRDPAPRLRLAGAAGLALAAFFLRPYVCVELPVSLGVRAAPSDESARAVVGTLLENVYRAFDFREEEAIYDALARSTSGELLTDVYLETRRSLELENQGGARVRVGEVELVAVEQEPLPDGAGFASRCTWNVAGSVGHWGHLHQRVNQYEADLEIRPVDGEWRITGIELLGEVRL